MGRTNWRNSHVEKPGLSGYSVKEDHEDSGDRDFIEMGLVEEDYELLVGRNVQTLVILPSNFLIPGAG